MSILLDALICPYKEEQSAPKTKNKKQKNEGEQSMETIQAPVRMPMKNLRVLVAVLVLVTM